MRQSSLDPHVNYFKECPYPRTKLAHVLQTAIGFNPQKRDFHRIDDRLGFAGLNEAGAIYSLFLWQKDQHSLRLFDNPSRF